MLRTVIRNYIQFLYKRFLSLKNSHKMRLLNQEEAIEIDKKLFQVYQFSLDQLMELAGLGCALSIADCYQVQHYNKVLICCGPGNNGGDGLVCARHLQLLGYEPTIFYPKPNHLNQHFVRLLTQIQKSDIRLLENEDFGDKYHIIVDALFGFSFKPPVRPQFQTIMSFLKRTHTPIISIDIPSGWDVEKGNINDEFIPQMLISLTCPKKCTELFAGKHYLTGRFVPQALAQTFQFDINVYQGSNLFVKL